MRQAHGMAWEVASAGRREEFECEKASRANISVALIIKLDLWLITNLLTLPNTTEPSIPFLTLSPYRLPPSPLLFRTFSGSVPVKVTTGSLATSEGNISSPIFIGVILP